MYKNIHYFQSDKQFCLQTNFLLTKLLMMPQECYFHH